MKTASAQQTEDDKPIHLATVDWERGKWSGVRGKYSRQHVWIFADGLRLKASDALAPGGYRDPSCCLT